MKRREKGGQCSRIALVERAIRSSFRSNQNGHVRALGLAKRVTGKSLAIEATSPALECRRKACPKDGERSQSFFRNPSSV